MTENQRLFIETARAFVESLAYGETLVAREAQVLRLTETLDAAAVHGTLFDELGYATAEGLMLAAQKLADRAAERANADPWIGHFDKPIEERPPL